MPLTSEQNIPDKPKASEPWTFKRLFLFSGAVNALGKVFTNPFDVLLAYCTVILGLSELFNLGVSWVFGLYSGVILAADVYERRTGKILGSKDKPKEK